MINEHCIYTHVYIGDGSVVLAKYLEKHPMIVKNKKVLEVKFGIYFCILLFLRFIFEIYF